MKPLRVAQDVPPVSTFKGQTTDSHDRLRERAHFMAAVERGLADADEGRVVTDEALGRELDLAYGPLGR